MLVAKELNNWHCQIGMSSVRQLNGLLACLRVHLLQLWRTSIVSLAANC